jgi:hypothetical protein
MEMAERLHHSRPQPLPESVMMIAIFAKSPS